MENCKRSGSMQWILWTNAFLPGRFWTYFLFCTPQVTSIDMNTDNDMMTKAHPTIIQGFYALSTTGRVIWKQYRIWHCRIHPSNNARQGEYTGHEYSSLCLQLSNRNRPWPYMEVNPISDILTTMTWASVMMNTLSRTRWHRWQKILRSFDTFSRKNPADQNHSSCPPRST